MPRRKQINIKAQDLSIYQQIVSELSKNPKLTEEYDMGSIEITIKKKYKPQIQDIDQAIRNLEHYYAANKEYIETLNGKQLIFKKDIAKMLKISRLTLDKWIEKGFIRPSLISGTTCECFQINEVIEQLRKQKQ